MSRLIGDRTGKSALDEMEEVARERNRDVAEEERLERLEAARRAKEEAERNQNAEKPNVPSGNTAKGILGNTQGILYGQVSDINHTLACTLQYYSLTTGEGLALANADGPIHAIYADNEEVYFADNDIHNEFFSAVRTLFDKRVYDRPNRVAAIYGCGSLVFDAGNYGILKSDDKKLLLDEKQVEAVSTSADTVLYALMKRSQGMFLKLIATSSGFCNDNGNVIDYGSSSASISQVICVPGMSEIGQFTYACSFISCAHTNYLDINNEKIKGSEEESGIYRLGLLGCTDNIADIAYGGAVGQIKRARIDLKERKVIEKGYITTGPEITSLHSLFVVHNADMHEKLMRHGRMKHVDDLLKQMEEKNEAKAAAILKKAEDLLIGDEKDE